MAFIIEDRVQETTGTIGSGSLALGGAITGDGGFRSYGSVMAVGDTCEYLLRDYLNSGWEVGLGTYSAVNTLSRTRVYASSNNGAALNLVLSAGKVVSLTLPAQRVRRSRDRLNARDYGATGDGVTSDGAALTALGVAAAAAGKDAYIPAGTYYVYNTTTATQFVFSPGITYYLDRRAVIVCDSTANAAPVCNNAGVAGDYTIIGGTFKGRADVDVVERGHNVAIYSAGIVRVEDVTNRYSNSFAFALTENAKTSVINCTVYRSLRDGICVWNTPDVLVTGCDIEGVVDDAISCHTSDTAANPRAVVVITNNRIRESQGINVLGAKMVTISGNICRLCFGSSIAVGASGGFGQGDTPNFGVHITGNQIFDPCGWPGPTPRNGGVYGIVMTFPNRSLGGATSAPGDPAPTTGVPSPLLGAANTPGVLYNQTLAGPQPGAYWIEVSRNTIVRTRPSVTSVSQWGGASSIWMGANTSGSTYSGAITETNFYATGIFILGSMRDSRISGNTIRTSGPTGINFSGPGNTGDFDGLEISGNKISDYAQSAVLFTSGGSNQRMRIFGNTFDADPGFKHSNRGVGGTWLADNYPHGINPSLDGMAIENNHFRNMVRPISDPTIKGVISGNVYFGNVTTSGTFSTTNVGIGVPWNPGVGWQSAQEDADPRSATYGRALSIPTPGVVTAANALYAPIKSAVLTGATGGAVLTISSQASAVNGITLTGVNSGSGSNIAATGADTNVSLVISGKGAGILLLNAPVTTTSGCGVFNHAAPATQPARAVTLTDVINVLAGCGLTA